MPSFRVVHILFLLVCWAGTAKVVVLPWLLDRASRGNYLYGHYSQFEALVGAPLLLVTAVLSALLLVPPRRRRAVGLKVIAAMTATLLALGAFDLAFAMLVKGALRADYWLDFGHISRLDSVPDQRFGFVRKPGVRWHGIAPGSEIEVDYATDERGFRNPDGTRAGELMFVGDSYTEAAQMQRADIFATLVGERLDVDVVNLGRGAYGPQQELMVLKYHALTATPPPRTVVWQWFEGNDLQDAEQFLEWRSGDYPSKPLLQRYLDNSFFQPFLAATYRDKQGTYVWYTDDDGVEAPTWVRYPARRDWTAERAAGWEASAAALREGISFCREAGVELVVVFVPVAARVLHPRWRFVDDAARAKRLPEGFTADRSFADGVRAICVEERVEFVDLLPVFQRAAAQGVDGIYLTGDEHFDRRGHALVADELARRLRAD